MRQITIKATEAFYNRNAFSKSNTQVKVLGGLAELYLFNNLIAKYDGVKLWISNSGWQTKTTKERLNGLLDKGYYIYQKKGEWFIGNYNDSNIKIDFKNGITFDNITIF